MKNKLHNMSFFFYFHLSPYFIHVWFKLAFFLFVFCSDSDPGDTDTHTLHTSDAHKRDECQARCVRQPATALASFFSEPKWCRTKKSRRFGATQPEFTQYKFFLKWGMSLSVQFRPFVNFVSSYVFFWYLFTTKMWKKIFVSVFSKSVKFLLPRHLPVFYGNPYFY